MVIGHAPRSGGRGPAGGPVGPSGGRDRRPSADLSPARSAPRKNARRLASLQSREERLRREPGGYVPPGRVKDLPPTP